MRFRALPVRPIDGQAFFLGRSTERVLPLWEKGDALDPVKISDDDPCPRCGGKLEFKDTVECPTTGALVNFFKCKDCGHVRTR